jgi:hypothetical protein
MNAMKTITRVLVQIVLFLLIAFTVIMSFYACQKIEDPTRGVKLIVNYDVLKTNINVRFFDAASGEQIGANDGNNVSVRITGESASAVIDMAGESGKTYKSGGGYMTLYLNPNVEYQPSSDNPIRFTIVAQIDGYLETGKSMVITKNGDYFVDIAMVKSDSPPEGVIIATGNELGKVVQGEVKEDISFETDNSLVSVFIPQGTIIKDENGTLLAGYLNIEISYFNNLLDQSLAAFPGGLLSGMQKDGEISDGVFYTAGFVLVVVTDKRGKVAKTFEGSPLELKLKVPDQTYNPQTLSNVISGNGISVYSFDPSAGLWNYEQSSGVEGSENGLEVTAQLNHLSYWNFGWFFGNSCDQGARLLFTGDANFINATIKGIMRKAEDNTFLRFVNIQAHNGEPVILTNAPADLPVYVDWIDSDCSDYYVDPASNPLNIDNLCSNTQYNLPVVSQSVQNTTVLIDVAAHCAQYPDVEVHPTFGVWFRESDKLCWRWAFMSDGKADIPNMEIGKNYVIGAYYDNTWNEWEVNVTQEEYVILDMELPDDICDMLFK